MQGSEGGNVEAVTPLWQGRRVMLAIIAGVICAWPARPPWSAIIGHSLGETDNHLWMFWVGLRRALGDDRALVNLPDGLPIPLMDPVNLPVFAAFWAAGPVIAWSAVIAANLALALIGGALLAREVAGEGAELVGAVALVSAPFLAGVIDFGITESWPLGLFALHAACLLRHGRTGERRWALGAGLSLGAIALSGWYHAFFGVLLEAMLVPWVLWRYRRPGTALQGLIGLACAIPPLLAFLPVRGFWKGRYHPPPLDPAPTWPDWLWLPRQGTDLLNLLIPRWETVAPSKAVYLGVVLLLLVLRGLWRAPRQAGPMVILALPFLALALGHWPRIAGEAIGFRGPSWFFSYYFPALQGISHWHRAVGAAVPFLAAAAAVGARDLLTRRHGALLLTAALVTDAVAFSQTPWPRPAHEPTVPAALLALGDPGEEPSGVIQLPFDNARVEFTPVPARLYNQWQVFHQHPVSENYEGTDALLVSSRLVAALDGACGLSFTGPRAHGPNETWRRKPVETDPEKLAAERHKLLKMGYRWVVLHEDRAQTPERVRVAMRTVAGEGRVIGSAVIWDLQRGAGGAGAAER